jgi:hypothetical protein
VALIESIDVPPHVEPLKRHMLGQSLLGSVSAALRAGDVEKARTLMRAHYYPALHEQTAYVIAHRMLALLPPIIARSSASVARQARRRTRALASRNASA